MHPFFLRPSGLLKLRPVSRPKKKGQSLVVAGLHSTSQTLFGFRNILIFRWCCELLRSAMLYVERASALSLSLSDSFSLVQLQGFLCIKKGFLMKIAGESLLSAMVALNLILGLVNVYPSFSSQV